LKCVCVSLINFRYLQPTETITDDETNENGGSIENVLNIMKNVVGKVGNLLNGNSESENETYVN